ncbi:MAG: hypothetical protein HRT58_04640 [Crocinitomicaceae bacterium]|nr:hypothetical protein [Flavobacteriales bacterium]NQZ34925.1 hypothetical protein [Crocinitomicaceae bacterium]
MKHLNLLTLLLVLAASSMGWAQDFDLQWSEKKTYENKEDGYFTGFLGSNEKYVYTIYNNLTTTKRNAKKKRVDLVAQNKETMEDVHRIKLRGDKDDPGRKVALDGKAYHKTIILEDVVYVFWTLTEKNVTEIYAEVFDADLNQLIPLTEVYSITYPEVKKRRYYRRSPIVILSGKEWNNDVLIGTEVANGQGESVDFEYKVFDSQLEELVSAELELPIVQIGKKSAGLTSSYEYGVDGNLYIQSYITLSREERQNLDDGEQSAYSKLSIVDIASGELTDTDIRFDGKNIFNFGFLVEEDGVRLFGFYNDLEIDPKGTSTNGIFYATIDKETNELKETIFSAFDEATLDELFANDEEDKKKTRALFKKKRKANEEIDKVSLDSRYVIESVKLKEDKSIVLFCSKMYNYTVTVCTSNGNGGTTCREVPYCDKSNVTVFNLDPDGELNWSKNVDRFKTYGGHYIYDLRVLTRDDKAYVIYGSSYAVDAEEKKRKNRKKKAEVRDNFEYAVFDLETGDADKREFVVNTPEVEKADRKYVSPLAISIVDDEFYVNSQRIKFKPGLTAAGCVASLVCWPVLYFVALSPVFKKGVGHIGKLEIIE